MMKVESTPKICTTKNLPKDATAESEKMLSLALAFVIKPEGGGGVLERKRSRFSAGATGGCDGFETMSRLEGKTACVRGLVRRGGSDDKRLCGFPTGSGSDAGDTARGPGRDSLPEMFDC